MAKRGSLAAWQAGSGRLQERGSAGLPAWPDALAVEQDRVAAHACPKPY